jgi:hypothetical protein
MLKIRPQQLEAFKSVADTFFVKETADYIRREHREALVTLPDGIFPAAAIPDARLQEMVRLAISRARQYGFVWESNLVAFVAIMFVVAPNFDDHPLIRRVLKDEELEPSIRLDELMKRTSEENWEEARRRYDPSAWKISSREDDK